jgi:predicted alpha/beta-fold hydrolase
MKAFVFPGFRPLPLLKNGHLQTIVGFAWSGTKHIEKAVQVPVTLPDGDLIVLHDDCPSEWEAGDPVALLLHGICGSHRSPYMVRAAAKLNRRGVRTFRMDQRGCGAAAGLALRPSHGGRSEDAAAALRAVARLCPDSSIHMVGYSLGGNMALRTAGEVRADVPDNLASVMAVSPPVDLMAASDALERPFNEWLYGRYFTRALLEMVAQPPLFFGLDPSDLPRARTLREFNDRFLAPASGLGTADGYYSTCGAAPLLTNIDVPALILTARDDPVIPIASLEEAVLSPSTRLVITDHGGHLGFLGTANPPDPDVRWMDWRVVDWVTSQGRSCRERMSCHRPLVRTVPNGRLNARAVTTSDACNA